jgi:DNA-binding transcriptional regulator GbsR (MarR family)
LQISINALEEKLKTEISSRENAAGVYKSSVEELQAANAAIKQKLDDLTNLSQSEKQVYSIQTLGYD